MKKKIFIGLLVLAILGFIAYKIYDKVKRTKLIEKILVEGEGSEDWYLPSETTLSPSQFLSTQTAGELETILNDVTF